MCLFGSPWKGSNVKGKRYFKSLALIHEMDDKNKARVAAETGSSELAKYAMKDLKDPELFYEIARDGRDLSIRLKALESLRSQELMGKLATLPREKGKSEAACNRERDNYSIRMEATARLHIQEVLRTIAFDLEYPVEQRREAMSNFTSPADLERYAREEIESKGRLYAFDKIKDEALRKEIKASWNEEQRTNDRHWELEKEIKKRNEMKRQTEAEWRAEGRCVKCGIPLDGRSEFHGRCRFCGTEIKRAKN